MSRSFRKAALALMLVFLLIPSAQALANKSAVGITITAPDGVTKGSEVAVTLQVTHSGNNLFHYTNWVSLTANGKEVSRWEFSSFSLPENENFTLEFKLLVEEPVRLEAQANCNQHGSAGKAVHSIDLK